MRTCSVVCGGLLAALICSTSAAAQTASGAIRQFEERCATCHRNAGVARAAGAEQAPDFATLQKLDPDTVYAALTNNPIPAHAQQLPDALIRGFAEFVGGRKLGRVQAGAAATMPNHCAASTLPDPSRTPAWNGWGADPSNGRFQTAQAAELGAAQVPGLKLKWAFGFPGAASIYGQPTVAAGRIFIGVDTGYVYSLDATTGCVFWSFHAAAGVRNAINIGAIAGHGASRFAAYFGDLRGNVYAIDAATGLPLWIVSADQHPLAAVTGAPTLYNGRLYVPVASREEAAGGGPDYPCCTFRGSVVALNADTERQIWKTYIIPDEPKPTRKNSRGVQLFAPSGAGLWGSPTIDASRRAIYIGTGDAYSKPPVPATTDAVIALDLDTGTVRWSVQHTPNDVWLVGCDTSTPSENCPAGIGPDYDFGAASIMRTLPDGRTIVVSAQKSGEVYAQDVRDGALVWKATLVDTLARGEIVFGGAADGDTAYFGTRSSGVAALDLRTGERRWVAAIAPFQPPRQVGQTAALSVIPGVVFSGGSDGMLRAFAAGDGRQLWSYDTLHDYATVNGVAAQGGAMGAPGPTIAAGMVFAGSGYTGLGNGRGGNVLLAFAPE